METDIKKLLALVKGANRLTALQRAEEYHRAVLKASPWNAVSNYNMGILAEEFKKPILAIRYLTKAIETDPSQFEYWNRLVKLYLGIESYNSVSSVANWAYEVARIPVENFGVSQESLSSMMKLIDELSVVLSSGRNELAIEMVNQYKDVFSDCATLINIMGVANANLGRLDRAISNYLFCIQIKPFYADPYSNLAKAYLDLGKLKKAFEFCQKAININPEFEQAHINLGLLWKQNGKLNEALKSFGQALKVNPNSSQANALSAKIHREKKNFNEAIKYLNASLELDPKSADNQHFAGIFYSEIGQIDKAISHLRKAISLRPSFAEAYSSLGNIFTDLKNYCEAKTNYKKSILIDPGNPNTLYNYANVLRDTGEFEIAKENYLASINYDPENYKALNNLGNMCSNLGERDNAIRYYKQAIRINVRMTEIHRNLSKLINYNHGNNHLQQMKSLNENSELSAEQRCSLQFALGKAYEDCCDFEAAFKCFVEGNQIKKTLFQYDISQDQEVFRLLKERQKVISSYEYDFNDAASDVCPIFIIGMPRSGTTLVEQILSCHPLVFGAGELEFINQKGWKFYKCDKNISLTEVSDFRNSYLSFLKAKSNGKPYVIDKMPQNFGFLPLLLAAFPQCKIIHVTRDPFATCWSNFKNYFVSDGIKYSYDLYDNVRYYGLYTDLMNTWYRYFPNRIIHCNYDRLVLDQKNEIDMLLKKIDLAWEENCLYPHKNKRSVQTASNQQVREPIYNGSSFKWKQYEKFIGSVFDELSDFKIYVR